MKIIKSKIFRILIVLYVLGIILGIISSYIIDNDSLKEMVIEYFNLYNNKLIYSKSLLNLIKMSFENSFFIWISGLLVIGIVVIPFLIVLKTISSVLILICIIECFGIKGFFISLILLLFSILVKDVIYLVISYYSINMSLKEIKMINTNKMISLNIFYKNYILRYIILLIMLILVNIFETYILSNIIKYIII